MLQYCRYALIAMLIVWMVANTAAPPTCMAITIDAQQQLGFADHLFQNQQYHRAAEEYQRFAYFFKDHPQQRFALYKSGESFLLAGDGAKALDRFKTLTYPSTQDAFTIDADFMMVECYINLGAPTQAVLHLHNIIIQTDDINIKDRAYHRLGWLHIHYTDWLAAQKALSHISPVNRSHFRSDEVNALLDNTAQIPRKSPALAGTLSIIPGAGQLYCHRYEDAFIAFLVNVGLGWAASDAFHQDQPALGGLLAFVGLGFYAGNIYGAISDAHKYNRNQKNIYLEQLKQYQVREVPSSPNASAKGLFLSLHVPF